MVGLHHDDLALADPLVHMLRRVPEVGQIDQRAARAKQVALMAVGKPKPHGVLRVVRHRKGLDLEIGEAESRARLETLPVGPILEFLLKHARRGMVGKHAHLRELLQPTQRFRVVAVLVREENGVDPLQRFAHAGEQLPEFPRREPGVDQHARALGDQQGAVARAATAEDAKTHGHDRSDEAPAGMPRKGFLRAPPQAAGGSGFFPNNTVCSE